MTIILTLLALWLAPQASAPVSGIVIDAVTRAPVAGARVLLARTDGPIRQSIVVETDQGGRFEAPNVPSGAYRWFADAPGYLRREAPPGSATIALVPTAVIAGRVLTERGDPAPRIYVRAWSAAGNLVAESQTNDLGEYRLFDLLAGAYVISAERYLAPRIDGARYTVPTPPCPDCPGEGAGMQALTGLMTQGAFVDPRAIGGRSYPAVFFPAATDRGAATPIEVGAGQQIGGIEFRLIAR